MSAVAHIELPRRVDSVEQFPIGRVIAVLQAEADQVQRNRCGQLEILAAANALGEVLSEYDMMSDHGAKSFDSVVTDHKP